MIAAFSRCRLRQGLPVLAEEFESATVFFSDVANFASYSAHNTPIETVDFLNSIYTFLDEVIEKFDAYKVDRNLPYNLVYMYILYLFIFSLVF